MTTRLKTLYTLFDENVDIKTTNPFRIEIIKNSEGTLRFYSGIDLTSATAMYIKVKDPSGAELSWVATLDSSNSYYVNYNLASDDLNLLGEYVVTLIATLNGQDLISKLDRFTVVNQYEDKNLY